MRQEAVKRSVKMKQAIIYKATELYKLGYNSSQAVCAAFAEYYGIDRDIALQMASSFGDGTSHLGGTCGAADALVILSGFEKKNVIPDDPQTREDNYKMVQALIAEFKRRHGSIFCKDLRGNYEPKCLAYCLKLVQSSVEIYADHIGLK